MKIGAFSRCAAPAITRAAQASSGVCPFRNTAQRSQQAFVEEHVCQDHVSLVAFNRHLQLSNLGGFTMLETAIVLIVGFGLGYGVREWRSRRRRQAETTAACGFWGITLSGMTC